MKSVVEGVSTRHTEFDSLEGDPSPQFWKKMTVGV